MLLNSICVLTYSLTKCVLQDGAIDSCSKNYAIFVGKYPLWSLLSRKVQYEESQIFCMKRSTKYNFLGIYEIFNITNSPNLNCSMWLKQGIIIFGDSNFNIEIDSFFKSMWSCCREEYQTAIKVNLLFVSFTVPCLHPESSTCTTYGKICRKT